MNKALLNSIHDKIVELWPNDKSVQDKAMKRINSYFIPNIKHILETKFQRAKSKLKISLVGVGGMNVVIRISSKPHDRLFRVSYNEPKAEYEEATYLAASYERIVGRRCTL